MKFREHFSNTLEESEKITWADARKASVDAKKILEIKGFTILQISANGFRLVHDETNCVGDVIFDPTQTK